MSRPWLSILIPVYNTRHYIRECLGSIQLQWESDIEVLILDDCSTDDSLSLLRKEKQQNFPQLKIVNHYENKGLSAARNTLLEHSQGEYIWFLDSDDYLLPEAIPSLKRVIQEYRCDCVLFDYRVVEDSVEGEVKTPQSNRYISTFPSATKTKMTDSEALLVGMLKKRRFQAWTRVVKKCVWEKGVRFPKGRYFEDVFTTPRLAFHVKSYVYRAQAWVAYRDRAGSIVRTPSLGKIEDLLAGPVDMLSEWELNGRHLKSASRFDYYAFCGTNFINAMKLLKATNQNSLAERARFRKKLFDNFGFGPWHLCGLYIRNFRLLSLIRLLRHLYSRTGYQRDA